MNLRQKKKKTVLLLKIVQVKMFFFSPDRIFECVSEYTFLIFNKNKEDKKKQKKLKKKKEYLPKFLRDTIKSFENLICVVLTYSTEL